MVLKKITEIFPQPPEKVVTYVIFCFYGASEFQGLCVGPARQTGGHSGVSGQWGRLIAAKWPPGRI
jgi:hypothetical protein